MEYLTARNGPLRSSTGKIPKERNGAKPRSLPLISSPIPRVEKGWQGPHGRATQPTQSQALKERLASQNGGQGARKKATPERGIFAGFFLRLYAFPWLRDHLFVPACLAEEKEAFGRNPSVLRLFGFGMCFGKRAKGLVLCA